MLKRYKEALAACEYSIFLNAKHAPPHIVQAQVFEALGHHQAACGTQKYVSKLQHRPNPCL
jgi:hypothetical protein